MKAAAGPVPKRAKPKRRKPNPYLAWAKRLERTRPGLVRFTLAAGRTGTLKGVFRLDQWTGMLPETDDYSIVLVMNSESARSVPYKLRVSRQ